MWRLSILIIFFVVSSEGKLITSELLDPEWQNLISSGGMHIGHGRTKRFVGLNENQPNEPHQSCLLPDGTAGHCRHLRYCIQEEFKRDFMKFMDYMCIIKHSAMGVCCSDSMALGASDSLAENQIAIAPKDKDGIAFMVDRI